ncbi:DUF389 domain-containing protein [Actinomycetospora termitidis]|uniref:DUF389 domain-containing protein n=1 Tax=Actinomycetospora termitidis TaxID=3053470 RepID=A0ABT7M933_9PSEU|nr:DUF389 domain-containing protein [Actinomycetospora sp. Odt1-22]MDL5156704.1 DUF389 domain-containing protein [Actinomycetospora sp. Odt1-22]
MLHLRVVCPAERTDELLGWLTDAPGVAHLTVSRGAAVSPAGDLLGADIAREAVDDVLAGLCDRGVDRDGGITLEPLDTVLSDRADRAEEAVPGLGSDAVVWDELVGRSGDDAQLSASFLGFLTIACLLAAVGVVTNSPVTIVGAMVVGPEFGPLAALAVGLVGRRRDLAARALRALGIGFPVALVATALASLAAEAAGLVTVSPLESADQVDFIYQVGPFSLIVALLAGAAGMLAMTSSKSAALVGVFISVTTVPAAGYAVVAATLGDWTRSLSSVAQLLVNLVGIVIAAAVVLLLRTRTYRRRGLGRPLSEG